MRRPRGPRDEDKTDPIAEELAELGALLDRTRLGRPGATAATLAAEKARSAAKWERRKAKALARWERMSLLEQRAWADTYLRHDRKRRGPESKAPKAADLPLLFAISTIAEREREKAAKAREVDREKGDLWETHRQATGEEHRTPRATRPAPAPEAPAAGVEPPKPERPRKRRRGPGPAGYQIDGVFYPPIYDEDD